MKGFITAPAHNKVNRADATGAFHIGASQFQKIHGLPAWRTFENDETSKTSDSKGFLKLIQDQSGGWDVFAYFGHAQPNALLSADLHGRKAATSLANALRQKLVRGSVVMLYACNAGAPGGFAQWLGEELSGINVTVYGHLPPKGHTFTNPRVVAYPGGAEVVPQGSHLWDRWFMAMKAEGNDLWARFPFMTAEALETELTVPPYLMGRWEIRNKQDVWHEVFLDDLTVVRTDVDSRYVVRDQGLWSSSHHRLTIQWKAGATEEWDHPLNLHHQTITHTDNKGKKSYSAKQIESSSHNPRALFSGLPHPKQSKLIKVGP